MAEFFPIPPKWRGFQYFSMKSELLRRHFCLFFLISHPHHHLIPARSLHHLYFISFHSHTRVRARSTLSHNREKITEKVSSSRVCEDFSMLFRKMRVKREHVWVLFSTCERVCSDGWAEHRIRDDGMSKIVHIYTTTLSPSSDTEYSSLFSPLSPHTHLSFET